MTIRLEGRVGLVGGRDHPHAARRLRAGTSRIDWVDLEHPDRAEYPVLELTTAAEIPEGAFDLVASVDPVRVEIAGGPFSGVIGGVERLLDRHAVRGGLEVEPGRTEDRPALPHRTFWTWDHSSNWDLGQIGVQETGVFNPYGKPPGGFLNDYRAMVDFCSRNRIGAIVVYGFLRDAHGGVDAAAELCRYAKERGVRIVPGIAIGAYGGVYWDGDHPANLSTWLREHPEHAASLHGGVGFSIDDLGFPLSFPRSDYTQAACPSRPETLSWMRDSVEWLAETFEIGGINIESGDYGVCGCDRCLRRRGAATGDGGETWSHDDLAENFPPLEAAARAVRDDLWITCELQWDNVLDPDEHRHEGLPPRAIYQHTANRSYLDRLRHELTAERIAALPYPVSALRLHLGSQWNGDERTERHAFIGRDIADAARVAARSGMQGLTIWGEASPYTGANELNYLAFAYFGTTPDRDWAGFRAEVVDPLLGGETAADEYLAITDVLQGDPLAPSEADALVARVRAGAADAPAGGAADRWWRLADRVDRNRFARDSRSIQ
ncbi:hypothetical protein [Agromyces silvae]|uniref:hypothetical protein n=1 Tax=Agromyces silvae TaxID=3388266 RepID=UPI00280BA58E|nr:hypothetical protein [Agromyces protaetiae]